MQGATPSHEAEKGCQCREDIVNTKARDCSRSISKGGKQEGRNQTGNQAGGGHCLMLLKQGHDDGRWEGGRVDITY